LSPQQQLFKTWQTTPVGAWNTSNNNKTANHNHEQQQQQQQQEIKKKTGSGRLKSDLRS